MSSATERSSAKEAVQSLLREVWKFVGTLGDNVADESGGSAWLVEQQWRHFQDACTRLLERSDNDNLGVAVVALTKSGKSTLLNALLGNTVLPTNAEPETARISAIRHAPSRKDKEPKMVEPSGRTTTGSASVYRRLETLNKDKRLNGNAWKMDAPLEILSSLPALEDIEMTSKLSLLDTPGPIEAKSDFMKHMVEKLLEDIDAVIYVLDYTKLKTPEEGDMLQDIQKINPSLVHRLWHRMFFLVNKFDVASTGQGLNEAETKHYVTNLLRDVGFKVRADQIMLVSAHNALLSRLVLTEKADEETNTKFGRLAFGMAFESVMGKKEWKARAERMLENSGILQLEDNVLSFLYSKGRSVKMLSLLDDGVKLLQEVGNVASSFKGALSRSLGDMRAGMDRLKGQLDNTMIGFDAAKAGLLRIEEDLTLKVRDAMHRLKHRLLDRIDHALSGDTEGGRNSLDDGPGWRSIHDDFSALTSLAEPDRSRAEEYLKDLHEEVVAQVRSEVEISWSSMEELIQEHHREVVSHMNDDLVRLSQQVEAVISKDLGIHLEPMEISFKALMPKDFDSKLSNLVEVAIKQQVVERNVLCKYLAGPTYTIHTFDGDLIREHFEGIVRDVADGSLKTIQALVKADIASQVRNAEVRLSDYSDRYMQAIQSAIDARIHHITANASTMQRVFQDLSQIKKLKSMAMELQHKAESDIQPEPLVSQTESEEKESPGSNSEEGETVEESVPPLVSDTLTRMGSGKLRYVPPRSRFQAQDAIMAGTLNTNDRADSIPLSDYSDSFWESPKSLPIPRPGEGGEGQTSAWRRRGTSQFSPRSDFFRSFDRAFRGGKMPGGSRGRGRSGSGGSGGHRRTGSWA